MGSMCQQGIRGSQLRLEDYGAVGDNPSLVHYTGVNCRVLKNKLSGNEIQEYPLKLEGRQELEEGWDWYEWRLSQDHVVRTLHMVEENPGELCSTTYYVRLYTERIPMRLVEIQDIPFPDNMYVMMAALDGFSKMAARVGAFEVHENMVGINKQGEVKIWLNDDLSKNFPEMGWDERYRVEMAEKVIKMVDENTDHTSQPSSLSRFILSRLSNPSFEEAMLLIKEYSKVHRVEIPTTFESIIELVNNPSLNDLDFNISKTSKIRTSILQVEGQVNPVLVRHSDGSLFSKLEYSLSVPYQSRMQTQAHTHSTRRTMNFNREVPSMVYHSVLPPTAVTTSIPVQRITYPQPQVLVKSSMMEPKSGFQAESFLQIPVDPYPHPASSSSKVIQPLKRQPTPILKNSSSPQRIQTVTSSQTKDWLFAPTQLKEQPNTQTASANLSRNATEATNHQYIKFVDIPDSSFDDICLQKDRNENRASQSAFFNTRGGQASTIRNPGVTIGNREQTRGVTPSISYYSPQNMYQMDPDIAKDLLALQDR